MTQAWDENYEPLTKPEVLEAPEKNLYSILASADFQSQVADRTYKIEKDSFDYPMYDDPVQIGTSDFYQLPPQDERGKVFAGDVDEKAALVKGALQLIGGYATIGGYSNRECRTEWRPANYKDITNTYKLTIDGKVGNSNSGFVARFQNNERKTSYYQFIVNSCNKSSGKPAWQLIKKTDDGKETVLMGSDVMPTQSTTGMGYLQIFNASITVIDKSTIIVDVTGKTNTGKDFAENKIYVDENPFDQDAHDQYIHFKSYGAATSSVNINSVKLESDPTAEAVGYKADPIDYGTVATAKTNKMTMKEFDKGYLTVIFDDNNDNLEPMFNIATGEFGFPICSAVPTKYIDRNGDLLERIQASGGEIISHTASHPQLNFSTPWTTVEEEFKTSYDKLTARGLNVNGIILSGGSNSDTSDAYAKAVEPITAKYYKYSDLYGVSPQYNKPRDSFSGMSAAQIKAIIDRVIRNKSWIAIYAHNFNEFPEATMREVFSYAKQKQQEGVFDIATYRTIYKNFAEFEEPVDWGKDTFKVTFYGSDNKTVIGTSTVEDGDNAVAPTEYIPMSGFTFDRWSDSIENITEDKNVYAICKDAGGNEVPTSHENVMVKSYDQTHPVLANTKRKILNDNSLNILYLNGTTNAKTIAQGVNDWLTTEFSGLSLSSTNKGFVRATTASIALLSTQILRDESPDLVVVQLTNNDTASVESNYVWSATDIKRQAELLVREIYLANPNADIVFVVDGKGKGTGSYEAYVDLADKYSATGIGVLDLNGIATTDYETAIDEFLRMYLKTVYVPAGTRDDHSVIMPENFLIRSPMLNINLIPATEFATPVTTPGGAIQTKMLDSTQTKLDVSDTSLVFNENDKASFKFTGTGFAMAFGPTDDEVTVKYQIDGHGWKEKTIPFDDCGVIIPFENELSFYEHTIELDFGGTTTVGGAYVYGIDNGLENITALSIDDGPRASSAAIMDVLKKYDAHATFFSVGINVKNASGIVEEARGYLQRMLDEGCEIGNHSNSVVLPDTADGIKDHFQSTQNKVFESVGVYPMVYRSPGNANTDDVFESSTLPLMNGYNIGNDWDAPGAGVSIQARIDGIINNAEDGRIILIHDNVYNAEALETALPNIAAKGLKVVSISELIRLRGYVAEPMKQYKAFFKTGPEIFAQHSSLGPID